MFKALRPKKRKENFIVKAIFDHFGYNWLIEIVLMIQLDVVLGAYATLFHKHEIMGMHIMYSYGIAVISLVGMLGLTTTSFILTIKDYRRSRAGQEPLEIID